MSGGWFDHKWIVPIFVAERPDGGMRVWSDELPGLVLSGANPRDVGADIFHAIQVIREYKAAEQTQDSDNMSNRQELMAKAIWLALQEAASEWGVVGQYQKNGATLVDGDFDLLAVARTVIDATSGTPKEQEPDERQGEI